MPRYRKQGLLSEAWVNSKDYNPPSGGGSLTGDTTYKSGKKSNGTMKDITDVVTPGFKQLQASGAVLMNPMTLNYTERSCGVDTFTFDAAGTVAAFWGKRVVSGTCACEWSIPPVRPAWFNQRIADAKLRTLQGCYAKIATPDFMALVTVKEARKTATMIAHPLAQARSLLARIWASAHRSVLYKGWTLAKALAAAWNEHRFGWKPLLYDIEGIWKAYVSSEVFVDKAVRLVTRETDKNIDWLPPVVVSDLDRVGSCKATMSHSYVHTARVSSGVLYELRDSSHEMATARRMGLRLSDVPAALWEVVPYSFIVDRFVDIGRWLNALTPKPGVTVLGSWTTVVDKELNDHKILNAYITFVPAYPVTMNAGAGSTYREEIHTVTRDGNPPFPALPTVNYRDLNLQQQIDHLALLVSGLKGLKLG